MQFPVEEIYVETALPFGLRTVLSFDLKAHFRQRLQRLYTQLYFTTKCDSKKELKNRT